MLKASMRDKIRVRVGEEASLSADDVQTYIVVSRLTYHTS
jgi:hypothetical protein